MRNHAIALVALALFACGSAPSVPLPPAPVADAGGPPTMHLRYASELDPGAELTGYAPGTTVDRDTWVTGWRAELAYVHHAGVWIAPPGAVVTDTTCSNCGTLLFTAVSAHFEQRVPAGGAIKVAAGSTLVLDVHRLNATDAPQQAIADLELEPAAEPPTAELYTAFADGHTISVPPGVTRDVTFTCGVPGASLIYSMNGHTHSHTTLLTASADGREVYRSRNWSDPETVYFDPPLQPKALTWTCTIANDTSAVMTWGIGARTAEMCQLYMINSGLWSCSR